MQVLVLALAPSLLWLWWFWRQEKQGKREEAGPLARSFFFGACATLPAALLNSLLAPLASPGGEGSVRLVECFLVIGPVEELCKYMGARLAVVREKTFDEPADGLIFAAASALGFAFVENLVYFAGMQPATVIVRSILSVPSHVLDAVPWGLAMGMQRCLKNVSRWTLLYGLLAGAMLHGYFDAIALHLRVSPALMIGLLLGFTWTQWRLFAVLLNHAVELAEKSAATIPDKAVASKASSDGTGERCFQWHWVWITFGLGLLINLGCFYLRLWFWPAADSAGKTVLSVVALVASGAIAALMSPGRTVRETALGLAILGVLGGIATRESLSTLIGTAGLLGVIGAFGGWLGESLQLRLLAAGLRASVRRLWRTRQ
jgi:RsiW-degrading membrane proteinase PrsW (M82 family)